MNYPSIENNYLTDHAKLLASSFYTLVGHKLVRDEVNLGKELFLSTTVQM